MKKAQEAMEVPLPPTLADIEDVYRRGFSRFLQVAEAIAGGVEPGSEAVQEGFARAIRARFAFRAESSLETWLWSCVLNAARTSRIRERSSLGEVGSSVMGDASIDVLPLRDAALADAVSCLPERQREMLFLRYYADLDYRSIAGALDVEVGTVGAALAAAHTTLRNCLTRWLDDARIK